MVDLAILRELAGWLKNANANGHARLCQGREYTCQCGFDDALEAAVETVGNELPALLAENERLRAALGNIAKADPVDLALDPEWPQRVALAALPAHP